MQVQVLSASGDVKSETLTSKKGSKAVCKSTVLFYGYIKKNLT